MLVGFFIMVGNGLAMVPLGRNLAKFRSRNLCSN